MASSGLEPTPWFINAIWVKGWRLWVMRVVPLPWLMAYLRFKDKISLTISNHKGR